VAFILISDASSTDLRRILLPDDWEGFPLRRDYPVEGYRDVPSTGELFRKSSTP